MKQVPRTLFLAFVLCTSSAAQECADLPLPPEIVAIEGGRLAGLLGAPPAEIVALATTDGGLRSAHTQIVERFLNGDGSLRYAFDAGEEPRPDPDRTFDADDLLLLWLPHAGQRLSGPGREKLIEVESGAPSWFYLRRSGIQEPPAPLVRYEAEEDTITTARYRLGLSHRGDAVIDKLILGPEGRNLLDRSKVRFRADLALGFGHVERTEEDVSVRTTGLTVGPLLVLREEEVRGRLLLGLRSPPARDLLLFTPHAFILPTTIRLRSWVRSVVRTVSLRITMDLDNAARGLRFASSVAPGTEDTVDGAGARGALSDSNRPLDWYLLQDAEKGLLGWIRTRSDYAREIRLYYRDDARRFDSPESVPGELGHHGYFFRHEGRLPEGDLRIVSYAAVIRREDFARIPEVIVGFDKPPRVVIHP